MEGSGRWQELWGKGNGVGQATAHRMLLGMTGSQSTVVPDSGEPSTAPLPRGEEKAWSRATGPTASGDDCRGGREWLWAAPMDRGGGRSWAATTTPVKKQVRWQTIVEWKDRPRQTGSIGRRQRGQVAMWLRRRRKREKRARRREAGVGVMPLVCYRYTRTGERPRGRKR